MTFSGEWKRATRLSDETGFVVAITAGNFLHQLIMHLAPLSILALLAMSWQSDAGTTAPLELVEFTLERRLSYPRLDQ
jgi:hypothetical protein